jgi:hypothetical protein
MSGRTGIAKIVGNILSMKQWKVIYRHVTFRRQKRRKQPERYATFSLKCFEKYRLSKGENYL